ncbi:TIGR04282 family arsenosugar biosynthesis glycosyltransferase [Psychroserpens sp.]|uniref:TIGR04282 family arsenosugar biosynthesis glycosyltransferase n=1 Tax=Psychroserpens sp. TaxID=2020870 RepID=UPI00385EDEE9
MSKDLVIVFVKNINLGKVKTRLAKTIGNQGAFEVYKELVQVTENATKTIVSDIRIYFSEAIVDTKWKDTYKAVQQGKNLGERMKNAFLKGFEDGYKRIVLIGSDLPDISASHIQNGMDALDHSEVVFGPAEDGGYYLIGMSKMNTCVFENKPWSQSNLLKETLQELQKLNISISILDTLNDIDTYEDLIASDFYINNETLQHKIKQLND